MIVELTETRGAQATLSPEQGRLLARSGVVTAAPSALDPGRWDVTAKGKVGVARIGGVELWIAPKLPIERLLFLVGYARRPMGWRDESVLLAPRSGLVPTVAQALWRQTEHALSGGLLQGYRMVEETSTVLRGRLREGDQLRRHHGLVLPLEIRHDDYGVDIAENRILLAALVRMLAVPRLDVESRDRLRRLRVRLADVSAIIPGQPLPSWQPSRLNRRYHNALRLAEMVWAATAPDHARGGVPVNAFLFDLPTVFEDFVTAALGEHLAAGHPGVARRGRRYHLDTAAAIAMRPDLVWEHAGRPVLVVDAKYKQERPSGYPDADLYQVLAYATALGLRQAHLVYARGSAEPTRYTVRHSGVDICCHALDLTHLPDRILAEVSRLGDEMLPRPVAA